jgi:hypothetical protein
MGSIQHARRCALLWRALVTAECAVGACGERNVEPFRHCLDRDVLAQIVKVDVLKPLSIGELRRVAALHTAPPFH